MTVPPASAAQVIERARAEWGAKHAALLPRAEFCAGSFFEAGGGPAVTDARKHTRRACLHAFTYVCFLI